MSQEVYQDLQSSDEANDLLFLTDWVFHFNPYDETWAAVPREIYDEYWNNFTHPEVLRSSNINTLIEILHRTKGDKLLIEKLFDGNKK